MYSATSEKSNVRPFISMSFSPVWFRLVSHMFGGNTDETFSNKITQRFLLTWMLLRALILVLTIPCFCSRSLILESNGRSRSTSALTRSTSFWRSEIVSVTNILSMYTQTIEAINATVGQITRRSVTQVKSLLFFRYSGGSRFIWMQSDFFNADVVFFAAIRTSSLRVPVQGHKC